YSNMTLFGDIYAVPYDLTLPRIVSALFNATTVLATVIIAVFLFGNIWWGMLAGLFLLLTPRFVFFGHLVFFVSLIFFFFFYLVLVSYAFLSIAMTLFF